MEKQAHDDNYFMNKALIEAKKAYDLGEVPVGAVIVKNNKIIAKGYNEKELKSNVTKHAEIIAISKACSKLKSWRLNDCTMYVTLEPCPMCAGAIMESRIKKVYFGAFDKTFGACGSNLNLLKDYSFSTDIEVVSGLKSEECSNLLKQFFKELRKNKK